MTNNTFAFGLGIGTQNGTGEWLEVYFPMPILSPSSAVANSVAKLGLIESNNTTLNVEQLTQLEAALLETGETEQAKLANGLIQSTSPVVVVLLSDDSAPLFHCSSSE